MVTLLLDQTQLELVLSPIERALAFRRSGLRIPREAIRRVQLTEDPWTWIRGVRSPGLHLPGVVAMGTWRASTGVDFVAVRGRKRAGVVIDLDEGSEFARLVITTRHGVALSKALRLDGAAESADVVRIGASPAKTKSAAKTADRGTGKAKAVSKKSAARKPAGSAAAAGDRVANPAPTSDDPAPSTRHD